MIRILQATFFAAVMPTLDSLCFQMVPVKIHTRLPSSALLILSLSLCLSLSSPPLTLQLEYYKIHPQEYGKERLWGAVSWAIANALLGPPPPVSSAYDFCTVLSSSSFRSF
jgi:hypothetical protein